MALSAVLALAFGPPTLHPFIGTPTGVCTWRGGGEGVEARRRREMGGGWMVNNETNTVKESKIKKGKTKYTNPLKETP